MHKSVNYSTKRHPVSAGFPALLLLLYILTGQAQELESLEAIRQAAENFVLSQINDSSLREVQANAASMDSRLRLAACPAPLETFRTGQPGMLLRNTVGVRCSGEQSWTIYVPVTLSALIDVVYTARPLVRGSILQAGDLELRQQPLNGLTANQLHSLEGLDGMEVTRALAAGQALNLNSLRARALIERGQEVVILAREAGIEVRMSGTALASGSFGERIPVRNLSSGKTIEAAVIEPGMVAVNL